MASKRRTPRGADSSKSGSPAANGGEFPDVSGRFARTTAPRELDDDNKRAKWGLPPLSEPNATGPYIIELNVQHIGGIPGAATAFEEIFRNIVGDAGASATDKGATERAAARRPLRISKSYYRCELSDNEWRKMLVIDESQD